MRIDRDTCEEILATITRNKTRSVLTAFSVFWGIFLLTVLLGGGHGLQAMMNAQFEGFATNSGFIASQQTGEAYKGFRKGRWWSLEIQDVERLRFAVGGLDIISPVYSSWGISAVYGDKKYDCMVKGLYPDYASIEQPQMSYGRFINDVDLREARKVCVIGKRVYEQLFPFGGDPCGEYIRVNGIYYRIVGVNVSEGNININGPASQSIILPFTTMSQTFHSGRNVDIICITAKKRVAYYRCFARGRTGGEGSSFCGSARQTGIDDAEYGIDVFDGGESFHRNRHIDFNGRTGHVAGWCDRRVEHHDGDRTRENDGNRNPAGDRGETV